MRLADVGLADIEDAARQVKDVAWATPLVPADRDADGKLLLKLECLQRTGSFKIRGAWNRMSRATDEERKRGFVCVSAGNHGQAVAWSAKKLGAPCTVWVPEGAVARKVDSMRAMGATVKSRPHEEIMDAMMSTSLPHDMRAVSTSRGPQDATATRDLPFADGMTYIHPFGDPLVMAGAGTVGLEIARAVPNVGTVLVPVGGGGLISGIATAIKALAPRAKVYGVQAAGADPLPQSFEQGKPVNSGAPRTMADGIAATRVFDYMWPLLSTKLDGAFRVSDDEIQRALAHLAKESHVVAEGAGAAALAAAWQQRDALPGPIVCVASGGNVDPALLAKFAGS